MATKKMFILTIVIATLCAPFTLWAQNSINIGNGKTITIMSEADVRNELEGKYTIYSPPSNQDGLTWYDSSDGTIGVEIDRNSLRCVGDFVQMLYPGNNINGYIAEILTHQGGSWYKYEGNDSIEYFYLRYSSDLLLMSFTQGYFVGRVTKDLGDISGLTGIAFIHLKGNDTYVYMSKKGRQAFKRNNKSSNRTETIVDTMPYNEAGTTSTTGVNDKSSNDTQPELYTTSSDKHVTVYVAKPGTLSDLIKQKK